MLTKSGATHDLVYTTGPGHAQSLCADVKRAAYDCVISGSGDGMLHECLNGLLSTASPASADSPRRSARKQVAALPALAVVPIGSGNGVADSLYGRKCGPHAALKKIIEGSAKPIDVMAMRTEGSDAITYDLHFFSWAVFADHDYLTEQPLRFLGPVVKMILAPIIVILRRTFYDGVVDFTPAEYPSGQQYTNPRTFPPSPDDPSMRRITDGFWCFAVGNLKVRRAEASEHK